MRSEGVLPFAWECRGKVEISLAILHEQGPSFSKFLDGALGEVAWAKKICHAFARECCPSHGGYGGTENSLVSYGATRPLLFKFLHGGGHGKKKFLHGKFLHGAGHGKKFLHGDGHGKKKFLHGDDHGKKKIFAWGGHGKKKFLHGKFLHGKKKKSRGKIFFTG
jgi:hypothetical protein